MLIKIGILVIEEEIINHLGKNPKKGGRPPKEYKLMANKILMFFICI
jgi:hypothetical protein